MWTYVCGSGKEREMERGESVGCVSGCVSGCKMYVLHTWRRDVDCCFHHFTMID